MKKTIIPIALLLGSLHAAFAQTSYLETVRVENRQVQKQGIEVQVRMDVNLDGLQMKNQHTMRLVPVIVSEDGTQET